MIQFARALALAGFRATTLADIRGAAAAVTVIVDIDTPLHVGYRAGQGRDEAGMAAAPDALETVAYTRLVVAEAFWGVGRHAGPDGGG